MAARSHSPHLSFEVPQTLASTLTSAPHDLPHSEAFVFHTPSHRPTNSAPAIFVEIFVILVSYAQKVLFLYKCTSLLNAFRYFLFFSYFK
jgi:hypothetical protein